MLCSRTAKRVRCINREGNNYSLVWIEEQKRGHKPVVFGASHIRVANPGMAAQNKIAGRQFLGSPVQAERFYELEQLLAI